MHPRFLQIFLDQQLEGVSTYKSKFSVPSHTKKIFGNMRRIGKGFSGRVTPLFPTMVVQNQAKIGNTLQSDEDIMKLNELMELGTNLQTRVLDLEKIKTIQANEIASLKRRVKKLEKKQRSRTHKLKRLYKIGLNAKVESSYNEVSLDREMFDANKDVVGEEVFVEEVVIDKEEINEVTLAQALAELKNSKPKAKRIVLQEPSESTTTTTTKIKGKGLQAEFDAEQRLAREKTQKELEANISLFETWDGVQAKIDADYQLAERLQAKEQEELSDAKKATLFMQLLEKRRKIELVHGQGKEKRAGEELIQKSSKKQKVHDEKETTELKQLMEVILVKEELAIDVIPLAVKSPGIVDWKIYKEGKKSYYQIIRADGKSHMYMFFSQMLKRFDREDLEDLYKLKNIKFRGGLLGLKSLPDAVGITAAQIYVNTALCTIETKREESGGSG
nr:hypothetical protein [Tanacetum cinerariifolium]